MDGRSRQTAFAGTAGVTFAPRLARRLRMRLMRSTGTRMMRPAQKVACGRLTGVRGA